MDPVTLALIGSSLFSGLGSFMNARGANNAADAEERFRRMLLGEVNDFRSQGPGQAESFLSNLLMNTSQDGLFQMLRRSPNEQRDNAVESFLMGTAETGDPFDTSELFESLGIQDARRRDEGVGDILAGTSGLGERFGTAANLGVADFLARSGEGEASRNAQIAMGSHEAAQGRRQGALQQLMQLTQNEQGQQNIVTQLLLGFINSLGGMESGRRGQEANLLGMLGGVGPEAQQPGFGGFAGDIGSLLIMMPLLQQILTKGGTAPATTTAATPSSTGVN